MQGCQSYGVKQINSQNDHKVKHLRKVYFDVCDLKLEIRICFDTVLCHFHGVTFKNMSNKLKIFNAICAEQWRRVSTLLRGLIRRQQHNTPLKQKFTHCAIELKLRHKIITVYASVQCMYNSVTTNTYDSTRKSTFCIFTKKEN